MAEACADHWFLFTGAELQQYDQCLQQVCLPAVWEMTHWRHPFMFLRAEKKTQTLGLQKFLYWCYLTILIFSFSKVEEQLMLQFGQNCFWKLSCLKTKCVCNWEYLVSGLKKKNYIYKAVRINSPVNTLHETQERAVFPCEFCDTCQCEVHMIGEIVFSIFGK